MAAGELFAVVAEHLEGHPVAAHRSSESRADSPAGRNGKYGGDHKEAGVVVDPGEHLGFPAIGQRDPADQVELPQLHRCLALPTPVSALVLLGLGIDEPVADQHPVHRRSRWHRAHATQTQLVDDPPGTPAWMLTT